MGQDYAALELRPVLGGDAWARSALTAAISPAAFPTSEDEDEEKAFLQRTRGWRAPRLLVAYSQFATDKDLVAYFDAGANPAVSPVNVAASKAFRCYGLGGNLAPQLDWEEIRGSCVVLREMANPALPRGRISPRELVDTLQFFKDRDAQAVAAERDRARSFGFMPGVLPPVLPVDHPLRAAITRGLQATSASASATSSSRNRTSISSHGHAASQAAQAGVQQCATCGKTDGSTCELKACALCKSAWYCGRDCQKKDFKRHKKECASLARQRHQQ
ncbi:hypothetical protein HYH02_013755 [Chlamydomonas schloesseri]|uniref:MYND-type domain-containing protein n=1 Tax=Chlamydomonas schloesseri TaxID=2026947 RepID=A0A835VYC4_9CHLO|nr:hypothetical protein HYH02_013755 [Chlamydomonas schloesseri]|eukprot:KAG2430393.1 hypothetical protein HYH02_013755 [Chlamydomonas schloesseri]